VATRVTRRCRDAASDEAQLAAWRTAAVTPVCSHTVQSEMFGEDCGMTHVFRSSTLAEEA
jgi:hypothetical protein